MKCYLIVVYEFKRELSWNCHLGTAILDSPLQKREGNWAELTFAKTSGTASREREKIGHYLIPGTISVGISAPVSFQFLKWRVVFKRITYISVSYISRTTFLIEITHIPLLVNILFTIFLISWKSGRKSGFSTQHCFINSRSSSTLIISSDTVGRNGGISPDCTLFTISKEFKVRQRLLWCYPVNFKTLKFTTNPESRDIYWNFALQGGYPRILDKGGPKKSVFTRYQFLP